MAGILWLGLGGPNHKTLCWHSQLAGAAITAECNGAVWPAQGPAITDPALYNNVAIRIEGLRPNTRYPFVVRENGVVVYRSTGGYLTDRPDLQTHPARGTGFRIAWLSCLQAQPIYQPIAGALAASPDILIVFALGDTPYCDNNSNTSNGVTVVNIFNDPSFNNWCAWFESWHRNPQIEWLFRRKELVRIANDHEFGDSFDPLSALYPYLSVGQSVMRAWQIGQPRDAAAPADALYGTMSVGPLDLFMLDVQSYKSILTATDNSAKTMLGGAQKNNWLKPGLLRSRANFKLIASGYTACNTDHADSWSRFLTEYAEINDFINANNVTTVFHLGGDYHASNVSYTASPWHLNVNPCPAGVSLFHGMSGYAQDCVWKVNGYAALHASEADVPMTWGEIAVAPDWQSIRVAVRNAAGDPVFRVGELRAGINALFQPAPTLRAA